MKGTQESQQYCLFLDFEEAMRSDVAVRVADAARGTVLATRSNHHNFDFDGAQLNGIVSSRVN